MQETMQFADTVVPMPWDDAGYLSIPSVVKPLKATGKTVSSMNNSAALQSSIFALLSTLLAVSAKQQRSGTFVKNGLGMKPLAPFPSFEVAPVLRRLPPKPLARRDIVTRQVQQLSRKLVKAGHMSRDKRRSLTRLQILEEAIAFLKERKALSKRY